MFLAHQNRRLLELTDMMTCQWSFNIGAVAEEFDTWRNTVAREEKLADDTDGSYTCRLKLILSQKERLDSVTDWFR